MNMHRHIAYIKSFIKAALVLIVLLYLRLSVQTLEGRRADGSDNVRISKIVLLLKAGSSRSVTVQAVRELVEEAFKTTEFKLDGGVVLSEISPSTYDEIDCLIGSKKHQKRWLAVNEGVKIEVERHQPSADERRFRITVPRTGAELLAMQLRYQDGTAAEVLDINSARVTALGRNHLGSHEYSIGVRSIPKEYSLVATVNEYGEETDVTFSGVWPKFYCYTALTLNGFHGDLEQLGRVLAKAARQDCDAARHIEFDGDGVTHLFTAEVEICADAN